MSHDNFKLNLTKRPRYVVRGVLKQGKVDWLSNDGKMTSLSSFAVSSSERPSVKV